MLQINSRPSQCPSPSLRTRVTETPARSRTTKWRQKARDTAIREWRQWDNVSGAWNWPGHVGRWGASPGGLRQAAGVVCAAGSRSSRASLWLSAADSRVPSPWRSWAEERTNVVSHRPRFQQQQIDLMHKTMSCLSEQNGTTIINSITVTSSLIREKGPLERIKHKEQCQLNVCCHLAIVKEHRKSSDTWWHCRHVVSFRHVTYGIRLQDV